MFTKDREMALYPRIAILEKNRSRQNPTPLRPIERVIDRTIFSWGHARYIIGELRMTLVHSQWVNEMNEYLYTVYNVCNGLAINVL